MFSFQRPKKHDLMQNTLQSGSHKPLQLPKPTLDLAPDLRSRRRRPRRPRRLGAEEADALRAPGRRPPLQLPPGGGQPGSAPSRRPWRARSTGFPDTPPVSWLVHRKRSEVWSENSQRQGILSGIQFGFFSRLARHCTQMHSVSATRF